MCGSVRYLLYGLLSFSTTNLSIPFLVAVRRPTAWPGSSFPRRKRVCVSQSILIVDDNSLVRHLLRSWLEQHPEWEICGEAENGQLAVESVKQLRPDIVILDLQMPVMNGLEAARQISRIAPRTMMIMFTVYSSEQLLKAARANGIKDVVSKSDLLGEHLLTALRQAA